MERFQIEGFIGDARKVLEKSCKKGELDKTLRSKMSGFGAAVIMGGILPAIAYYSKNEKDVLLLLEQLYTRVHPEEHIEGDLFSIAQNHKNPNEISEELLAMSVSLKMAMNTFRLVEKKE